MANMMLLGGQTTEFHMYEYLPIASYNTGFGFLIVRYGLSLFAWKNGELLEDLDEFFCIICSHLTSFSMSPVYLGAMRGRSLSNGANLVTPSKPRVREKEVRLKRD